jgi:hypothetical protein
VKRFLPLIILILAPLSLMGAKPVNAQTLDTYVAQPGDSLWSLAENRVTTGNIMVINAVKNLEIMLNNFDETNAYLEVGQSYKLLSSSQVSFLSSQINSSLTGNAAYLIANPAPNPVWQELRMTAQSLSPTIIIPPFPNTVPTPEEIKAIIIDKINAENEAIPVGIPAPETLPQVQGAHTSIIPLADSPFPY